MKCASGRHHRASAPSAALRVLLGMCRVACAQDSDGPGPRGSGAAHVVVVGAGISGLCTAGRLMQRGVRVTLVEQNARDAAGGRLWTERLGPYRFEVGASLLLLPEVYRETFRDLGFADPFDAVVGGLERLDPAYGVFFDRAAWGPADVPGGAAAAANVRKVALGTAAGDARGQAWQVR